MRCDVIRSARFWNLFVSIHTPTWGVTWIMPLVDLTVSFNPHTYMRCDAEAEKSRQFLLVSIHTPTWGVTFVHLLNLILLLFQSTHLHEVWLYNAVYILFPECFNPHTYMRCDISRSPCRTWIGSFNPHTYMRCDQLRVSLSPGLTCFNPHTYMRCDCAPVRIFPLRYVSIHTPTWGVTCRETRS